ncbi:MULTISPECIES: hypothetical protein [unclassified Fusibacter]|uniref:hypothetical protein n=1 Tax=unclassified Fusibacter TaxID=2624464 RepID=UPI001011B08D|nr:MULTISPECIES: hypothetical protein [unclassified Fusibacter]MCK8060046.1 hypothetical protein [Fusibacter sp. A2]NPE22188.1 hypothetical protein [Fusibacter sp. A1]RXV60964.1 hypothetical protein DWB64_10105 [Fusibacter sp. A1]
MKVLIQDELKSYMHEHNHNIISLRLIHSDYNGSNIHEYRPSINYHEPADMDDFDEYDVDEFKVFVDKHVTPTNDTIEFTHDKLMGINFCNVEGVNLTM